MGCGGSSSTAVHPVSSGGSSGQGWKITVKDHCEAYPVLPVPVKQVPSTKSVGSTASTAALQVSSNGHSTPSSRVSHRVSVTSMLILEGPGKITKSYDLHERIGKGAYGSVFKATQRVSRVERAVKKCFKVRPDDETMFRCEAAILKRLDHPNIIRLYETYEERRCMFFVMEMCGGGQLTDYIISCGSFTEVQCAAMMKQIFQGVRYLHENFICHLDLKPDNFLLHDHKPTESTGGCVTLKIIDFGTAVEVPTTLNVLAGTPEYMAPEVLELQYELACDMWSCGVITYFLLSGGCPFSGCTDKEIFDKIREGSWSFADPSWGHITQEAKDLISSCLDRCSTTRVTAQQALDCDWLVPHTSQAVDRDRSVNEVREGAHVPLPGYVLQNMSKFQEAGELRKTALNSVAMHESASTVTDLHKSFLDMDVSGDGQLTLDEFCKGLQQSGISMSEEAALALTRSMDTDGSGLVDYTEFLAAAINAQRHVQEEVCWAAFRPFDRNGDGTISAEELEQVLGDGKIREKMFKSGKDVKSWAAELLSEADTSGDGFISFDEFVVLVTGEHSTQLLNGRRQCSKEAAAPQRPACGGGAASTEEAI